MKSCSEHKVLQPYPLEGVVIVGMGNSAYDLMFKTFCEGRWWKRLNAELWTLNGAGYCFPSDKVWSTHDQRHMDNIIGIKSEKCPEWPNGIDPTWLQDMDEPVICLEQIPQVKNCWTFDVEAMMKYFQSKYFTFSGAYAIAFAIMCGVKKIWFFGTDFNYGGNNKDDERKIHCWEYWLGQCNARGVQVILPAGLRDDTLYGFWEQPEVDENFDLTLLKRA